MICKTVCLFRIESEELHGFSFKTPFFPVSIPIAMAGNESVIKFINSRCTGKKGVGNKSNDAMKTQRIPAKLPDNK